MSTIHYRPDYAKFVFEVPGDVWHQYSATFHTASHQAKFHGEWLKSHKMTRLWFNAQSGMETWSVEIWGEWAGIVEHLPSAYFLLLRRFDVRAIVWDATEETVLSIGQHLQRNISTHNVYVYSSRAGTKRLGRDRGGKGFALGSHKSDLRISVYRRSGEPVAQEMQCKGAMLSRLVTQVWNALGSTAQVRSLYTMLQQVLRDNGEKRFSRILESAGVGTYWPVLGPQDLPALPPTQSEFIAGLGAPGGDDYAA